MNEDSLTIDLSKYIEYMKSYYLVSKVYEICGNFYDENDNPVNFRRIETNKETINYLSDVNFVFSSDVDMDNLKEKTKVGQLLILEVYFNPDLKNEIFFYDKEDKNSFRLEVLNL